MNDDIDMTFFFGGGMGKNQKGYNQPPLHALVCYSKY